MLGNDGQVQTLSRCSRRVTISESTIREASNGRLPLLLHAYSYAYYLLFPLPATPRSQGHFHNLEEGELNVNFAADVAGRRRRASVEARRSEM